jgi:hypothetical protein
MILDDGASPANDENYQLLVLPLDGGGLRWGWTCIFPPHPHPLPPGEREIIVIFSDLV